MPVFDFNQEKKDAVKAEKTYELVYSNERVPDVSHPVILLKDEEKKLMHHSSGMFTAPTKGTAFTCDEEKTSHDILQIDARFEKLVKWLGETILWLSCPVPVQIRDTQFIRSLRPVWL